MSKGKAGLALGVDRPCWKGRDWRQGRLKEAEMGMQGTEDEA